MTISYLVSTAGHAQDQNDAHPHDIKTILQLIEDGAKELGDEKVVGFPDLEAEKWVCRRYSFTDLIELSALVASDLCQKRLPSQPADADRIIAMLCPTGLDFLITWIALMRMGYGVVLVAPQCSPSAIASLLKGADSSSLLYHPKYRDLASETLDMDQELRMIPMTSHSSLTPPNSRPTSEDLSLTADPESTSHVFHTSGSSGNPKPIPNQHFRSVASLPRRAIPSYLASTPTSEPGSDSAASNTTPLFHGVVSEEPAAESAAFTTTPLFHGGVSDLLRAWMARSVLYLYPTSDVPVTPQHIIGAVRSCQNEVPVLPGIQLNAAQRAERAYRFKVTAFLSVPYILAILAEDHDGPGMRLLRQMDYVSTGGAPLDTRLGDEMVKRGVRLVSRLGSSECGFLLSSHRSYASELDWEWLRNDSAYADALIFEPTEDERKFQMIVTDRWKSKSKSNRPDGSYSTGDLYSPHPDKPNTWKYVGRGDDVIVMSNGEKASPGPIESVFRSSSLVSDALVVGSDRPQLGLLLFVRRPLEVMSELKPLLEEANRSSPSFAQLSLDMCKIIVSNDKQLPKSSKGTVQRGSAYEVFASEINALYAGESDAKSKRSLADIREELRKMILGIAGEKKRNPPLSLDTDLFNWGVDSLMATRVRAGIMRTFHIGDRPLPVNVVFERPSVYRLAQHVFDLQEGRSIEGREDVHQMMKDYIRRYAAEHTDASESGSANRRVWPPRTIVLTGATGSLGAVLVSLLSSTPDVDKIICLIRASDDTAASSRFAAALEAKQLSCNSQKVVVWAADLTEEDLGVGTERFGELLTTVDAVIHAAWPVHFASSLISFEDSFKGLQNLLGVISRSANRESKLFFCSSLASVLAGDKQPIREELSTDPSTASAIGYSQSKWVAEEICASVESRDHMKGRVKVMRIGQLCGDTNSGRWNEKEGWPLMIRTAISTSSLPLIDEKPSWLPVDLAAKAILDLVLRSDSAPLVGHIAHPDNTDWNRILDGLEAAGLDFARVSPKVWLAAVSRLAEEDPSRGMLPLWQSAYGGGSRGKELLVDTSKAQAASETMRTIPSINSELIGKMVQSWQSSGFLAAR